MTLKQTTPLLVDSHCHLTYAPLQEDTPGVMRRAQEAGVATMMTICTGWEDIPPIMELITQYPQVYGTVGVHPNDVAAHGHITAQDIVAAVQSHPKLLAIGECGLDFYREYDAPAQEQCFVAHLEAAQQADKPLVIHNRAAEEAMLGVFKAMDIVNLRGGKTPGIIHCFTGTQHFAEKVLDLGFYISISGVVTFKNAQDLQDIVKNYIPANRLLVETDAPFLAPVPHRGRTNEPAFVAHTAEYVACLKNITVEELAHQTTANFWDVVGKSLS